MQIKLIDVDGILSRRFKSVEDEIEDIRNLIYPDEFLICYQNLVDLTITKYTQKYNKNTNYSPYYESALKINSKNKSLILAYNIKQSNIKNREAEEYIDNLRRTIDSDKLNNLNYLASNLFSIFYDTNRNRFNLLELINSDFTILKNMVLDDLIVYFKKNFNMSAVFARKFLRKIDDYVS